MKTKYKMSTKCKGRKKQKILFKNQIKIKWRNKKPIEPRRLLERLCMENDKHIRHQKYFDSI
jgi:hypothetical protein